MKVLIGFDLEGISGVFAEAQTTAGTPAYATACEYLRADVQAAVEGCFAGGATEIVLSDGHDQGRNLAFDWLPPGVSLACGSPAPLSMLHGLDESVAAVLLVGYHARAGTLGAVLEHTYSYDIFGVRVGDRELGEVGINAGLAGSFGVPVIFVSGDDKVAAEACELLPGVECAVVKHGSYRTAPRLLAPAEARAAIRDGVARALRERERWPRPLDLGGQSMRVTFTRTGGCDAACGCPSVRRVDARSLEIPGGEYAEVFKAFLTCVNLAYLARE
jgi:D-amino peptidase